MGSENGYTKRVTWTFRTGGETWEITDINKARDWAKISETRKNGQEDDHTIFELELKAGGWLIGEEGRSMLNMHWYAGSAEAIEAFLNEHGLPDAPTDGQS